ncbi:MAG TPA: farnesyl diphosphate synthase [Methyloceanibacter sp.]|nr:farnesyl diphosphate synthase [Methyloceanibacter sp.]
MEPRFFALFPKMAFLAELERTACAVESRLDRLLVLDRGNAPGEARLSEAMRYATLGGGKRLRPFLLIESARMFGVTEEEALPAACALECVHCYSLAHDDLPSMDDDAVRRGRPTLHIAFGEATAILAGDALLTLAFEILSSRESHPDPAIRAELVHSLSKASGWRGMALGQALDLSPARNGFGVHEIAEMQALKTGALFRFACEAGAVMGRAGMPERTALMRYALAFGQAFQLADDLLDAQGDARALGKAVAKDHVRGKATLVALLGVEAAKERLWTLLQEAESALAQFGERAITLLETVRFAANRKS